MKKILTANEVQEELDKIIDCANQVQVSINNFYQLVARELPMRPLEIQEEDFMGKCWQCPTCGTKYAIDLDYGYDYCPNCGQRIDWR